MTTERSKNVKKYTPAKRHVAVAAAIIVVGAFLLTLWFIRGGTGQVIDKTSYQVVYMSNGQAYFGKLQNVSGQFLTLASPFSAQNPQQDSSDTNAAVPLVPVTEQVYGPENSIALRSENVLFWQNLRDDSKVTQAIKNQK